MRISKRGEYGLRAMIRLAEHSLYESDKPILQIKEISAAENIPAKFLEQILVTLKNAGLIQSKKGIFGGYYLGKPADQITFGTIFRILDGPLAPIKCVSKMAYEPCDCPSEETCGLRMVMGDVRNAIANILDNTTLADIASRVKKVREGSAE